MSRPLPPQFFLSGKVVVVISLADDLIVAAIADMEPDGTLVSRGAIGFTPDDLRHALFPGQPVPTPDAMAEAAARWALHGAYKDAVVLESEMEHHGDPPHGGNIRVHRFAWPLPKGGLAGLGMARGRRNDEERRLWVLNDEGLYNYWKRSGEKNVRTFIRKHRQEIDTVIDNVESGRKPQHYKAYPPPAQPKPPPGWQSKRLDEIMPYAAIREIEEAARQGALNLTKLREVCEAYDTEIRAGGNDPAFVAYALAHAMKVPLDGLAGPPRLRLVGPDETVVRDVRGFIVHYASTSMRGIVHRGEVPFIVSEQGAGRYRVVFTNRPHPKRTLMVVAGSHEDAIRGAIFKLYGADIRVERIVQSKALGGLSRRVRSRR